MSFQRILVAVDAFYRWAIFTGAFSGANPIAKKQDQTSWRVSDRHRPFLTGISRQRSEVRELRLKTMQRLPRPMNQQQVEGLIPAGSAGLRNASGDVDLRRQLCGSIGQERGAGGVVFDQQNQSARMTLTQLRLKAAALPHVQKLLKNKQTRYLGANVLGAMRSEAQAKNT